jgi:signal recognition particle receptor subunit beta
MVLFNYSTKELTAKVVYYGPGLCGKTTNLQWIHEKVPIKNKGKMLSLATETDRTLFFDFLPIEIGTIRGMRTRIQLYTVPGQVFYNATRRMVLKGADCLVFVCDSQEPMLDACIESFENLRQNLEANEIDVDEIPMVLQYNKRDLPNALPIEILNERMNPKGHPFYEAVAVKGQGVEETLKGVTKLVFKSLSARYGSMETAGAPAPGPVSGKVATIPPVAAAKKPPPPSATIPPEAARPAAQSPEDLLDSIDLTPPAVGMEFDTAPRSATADSTLIADARDAEEIRRRIARPAPAPAPDFEVNLEDPTEATMEEHMEEISLDGDAALPDLEPEPEATDEPTLPPMSFDDPPANEPEPVPPPPPPAAWSVTQAETARVALDVEAGRTDLVVPIELDVEPGVERIALTLRLSIKLRR